MIMRCDKHIPANNENRRLRMEYNAISGFPVDTFGLILAASAAL
jgi:hypothetical protein